MEINEWEVHPPHETAKTKSIPFLSEKGWCLLRPSEETSTLSLEMEETPLVIPYKEVAVENVSGTSLPFNYVIQVLDESIASEDVVGALNERQGGVEHLVLDYVQSHGFFFLQTQINRREV